MVRMASEHRLPRLDSWVMEYISPTSVKSQSPMPGNKNVAASPSAFILHNLFS